jgi:ABC-type transporter MlaC component
MRIRHFFQAAVLLGALSFAGSAFAEDAQEMIQREQEKVVQLLHQPRSQARDRQVNQILDAMVDYDLLSARCFGAHWDELNDAQKAESRDLIRQIVEKSWRRNLTRTLDYEVLWKGVEAGDNDGEKEVKTEAKSKTNSREPPVRVDYVVTESDGWKVIDIVTEGSSLTTNYYRQIHGMMTTDGQGYPYVVQKLKEKIRS